MGESRCGSRLPACIFVAVGVTRLGEGGSLSGADQGVEPRCVSKVWEGGLYSRVHFWLCANTRAGGDLNPTQRQQLLNKGFSPSFITSAENMKTDTQSALYRKKECLYLDKIQFPLDNTKRKQAVTLKSVKLKYRVCVFVLRLIGVWTNVCFEPRYG